MRLKKQSLFCYLVVAYLLHNQALEASVRQPDTEVGLVLKESVDYFLRSSFSRRLRWPTTKSTSLTAKVVAIVGLERMIGPSDGSPNSFDLLATNATTSG